MATTNMNLTLPVVTVTLGPQWATELNAALEVIDEHDHTSGKGKRVPIAGLNINADLNFSNYKISNLYSVQLNSNTSALSGASNASSLSVTNGDLYFTNGSGVAVQLTSGGSPVSVPASVQSLGITSINADLIISPASTFTYIIVDTTASRNITIPLASSVVGGRFYLIKDKDGLSNSNPITLTASGSNLIDGAASVQLASNYNTFWLVTDGISNWYVS